MEVTEGETGCDGVFETIYTYFEEDGKVSGSYIAAYPGSWWEYSNDDYLTCEFGEATILNFIERNFETCQEFYNSTSVIITTDNRKLYH